MFPADQNGSKALLLLIALPSICSACSLQHCHLDQNRVPKHPVHTHPAGHHAPNGGGLHLPLNTCYNTPLCTIFPPKYVAPTTTIRVVFLSFSVIIVCLISRENTNCSPCQVSEGPNARMGQTTALQSKLGPLLHSLKMHSIVQQN